MVFFSVFSVPQWQKRYTLQGDFTTACWIPIIHFLSLIIGFVLIWNECMLFCNYFTASQINKKILPQRHWKKLRRICLMALISVFSVPQWQKRYTLQGDFTTACWIPIIRFISLIIRFLSLIIGFLSLIIGFLSLIIGFLSLIIGFLSLIVRFLSLIIGFLSLIVRFRVFFVHRKTFFG